MQNSLLTCSEWAEQNFSSIDVADCRRTRRLVRFAAALAARPTGTMPAAIPKWRDLKAAYRLLDNRAVTFEKILEPHRRQVQASCSVAGQYLLIEDTTLLDFSSRRSLKGVGRIGDDGGRGISLHTTLAFRVERWEEEQPHLSLLGLAGQRQWVRADELTRGAGVRAGYERKKRRFLRARESERWGRVLVEFPQAVLGNQRVYIADREGDMYELFERCSAAGCDFVVRACQNRALVEGVEPLFEAVAKQVELGRYRLQLRARPGAAAREATIAVRARRVALRPPYRPGGKRSPRELVVVEAREINAATSEQEIHWVLLTSIDCATYKEARRIIELYSCRWIIEEYHKALKTGAGIEQSQLQDRRRLESLLGVLSLVAVRLLNLKLQAAESAETPLRDHEIEPEVTNILEAHFGLPAGGWTQRRFWIAVARLGGYLARKSDGPPGWQTLWRGWSRLCDMTEGAKLLRERCG